MNTNHQGKDLRHNTQEENHQAYGTIHTQGMKGYNRLTKRKQTRDWARAYIGEDLPSRHIAQTIIPETYAAESSAHQQARATEAMRRELYALAPHEKQAFADREKQLRNEKEAQVDAAWQAYTLAPQEPVRMTTNFTPQPEKVYASEKRALDELKAGKAMTFFGYTLAQLAPVRASIRTYIVNLAQQEGAELPESIRMTIERQNYRAKVRAKRNISSLEEPRAHSEQKPATSYNPTVLGLERIASSEDFKRATQTIDNIDFNAAIVEASGEDNVGNYLSPLARFGLLAADRHHKTNTVEEFGVDDFALDTEGNIIEVHGKPRIKTFGGALEVSEAYFEDQAAKLSR